MAGFNFYINGTPLRDEPEGFEDFEEELVLDFSRRALRFDYPVTLTFIGDGYNIIEGVYQEDLNGTVTLEIRDDRKNENKLVVKAKIKMASCEWNINKKTVECDIDDVTFQSRLFKNMKSEVYANAVNSINQNPITPIVPLELVLFNPVTGVDYVPTYYAFDVKDCFTMLVDYLTDGEVSFESSWYDSLPDDERLAVVSGVTVENAGETVAPLISFEKLFEEMWKKYNLFIIIENPLIAPVIRLESYDFLFNSASYINIDYVQDLKRSVDFEQLYSTVRLGSETTIKEFGTLYRLPYFQFLTFTDELYTVDTASGGGDNELGLLTEYIVDTNIFEDVLLNDSKEYMDDVFLVQYKASTVTATKGQYYDTGVPANRFYNEQLLNLNVARRFNFAGNLILNNGLDDVGFLASQTEEIPSDNALGIVFTSFTDMIEITPWTYQDDSTPPNYDANGNYNNTSFQYTCSQTGLYRFKVKQTLRVNTFNPDITYRLAGRIAYIVDGSNIENPTAYRVDKFFTSGSILTTFPTYNEFSTGFPAITITDDVEKITVTSERTIFLNTGQTVETDVSFRARVATGVDPQILVLVFYDGTFETMETPTLGGIYDVSNVNDAYVNIYQAESLGIEESDWEQVRINPAVGFKLNTNGMDFRICHGKRITRNFVTGETSIEALYNRNQSYI